MLDHWIIDMGPARALSLPAPAAIVRIDELDPGLHRTGTFSAFTPESSFPITSGHNLADDEQPETDAPVGVVLPFAALEGLEVSRDHELITDLGEGANRLP